MGENTSLPKRISVETEPPRWLMHFGMADVIGLELTNCADKGRQLRIDFLYAEPRPERKGVGYFVRDRRIYVDRLDLRLERDWAAAKSHRLSDCSARR